MDASSAARALAVSRSFRVELPSGEVELGPGDVEVRVGGHSGYVVSREASEVVALDLNLTDDLHRRGLVGEVIRQVQDLRRETWI
jgi:hypothetical protein